MELRNETERADSIWILELNVVPGRSPSRSQRTGPLVPCEVLAEEPIQIHHKKNRIIDEDLSIIRCCAA